MLKFSSMINFFLFGHALKWYSSKTHWLEEVQVLQGSVLRTSSVKTEEEKAVSTLIYQTAAQTLLLQLLAQRHRFYHFRARNIYIYEKKLLRCQNIKTTGLM